MRLTVAAVQASPVYLDLAASLAKAQVLGHHARPDSCGRD